MAQKSNLADRIATFSAKEDQVPPVPLPANSASALRVRNSDHVRRPSGNKAAQLLGQNVRPVQTFTQSERASDSSGSQAGGLSSAVSPMSTSQKASKILGVNSLVEKKRASEPSAHDKPLRSPRSSKSMPPNSAARSLSSDEEDKAALAAEARRTFGRAKPRMYNHSEIGGSISSSLDESDPRLTPKFSMSSLFSPLEPSAAMVNVKKKLYQGEEVYISSENCRLQYMYNDNSPALPCSGALLVTNVRTLFVSLMKDHEKVDVEIPHVLVSDVKEFFIPGLDESKFLVLHLKDYRIISLRVDSEDVQRALKNHISTQRTSREVRDYLCAYLAPSVKHSPFQFTMSGEMSRQGYKTQANLWATSDVNFLFDVTPEGPKQLVLPAALTLIDESRLKRLAKLHSGRLPTYCWSNWDARSAFYGAVLVRSWRQKFANVPKTVVKDELESMPERTVDQESIEAVFTAVNSVYKDDERDDFNHVLKIYDTGSEVADISAELAVFAEHRFLDLSDASIRLAHSELNVLATSRFESLELVPSRFLALSWFSLVGRVIEIASSIVSDLRAHYSVVIQCGGIGCETDGVLASLAQVMCDPHYRTLKGFLTLLEKDWIYYGFPLSRDQEGVALFLFIYAVWSLMQMYPEDFEFTEKLLVRILDDLHKRTTRTFAIDLPCNREKIVDFNNLPALFDDVLATKAQYVNPSFNKADKARPYYSPVGFIVPVWASYFLHNNKSVEMLHLKVRKEIESTDSRLKLQEKAPVEVRGLAFLTFTAQLASYRNLSLEKNYFTHVPADIMQLSSLTVLSFDHCKLLYLSPYLASLNNLRSLSACHNSLKAIPGILSKCIHLKELYLDDNKIIEFPRSFHITSLVVLSVSHNHLRHVPVSMQRMPNLEELHFSHNQLRSFPTPTLRSLTKLRILDIASNNFTSLPQDFSPLTSLETLKVSSNKITEIPASIGSCKRLLHLYAADNKLTNLPESLGTCPLLELIEAGENNLFKLPRSLMKCTRLAHLDVHNNLLDKMPECVRTCPLRRLNVSHNRITSVSASIARLHHLSELDIRGNEIDILPSFLAALRKGKLLVDLENVKNIPTDILAEGIDKTLIYLALTQRGKMPTYRMKLVVVGETGHKSRLMQSITKKWIQKDDTSETTSDIGLTISNYGFPVTIKSGKLISNSKKDRKTRESMATAAFARPAQSKDGPQFVQVSVWDFASADIYNASNRFLSASSSAYLVLFRLSEDGVERRVLYWCHSIKAQGQRPSVVLVGTYGEDETSKKKELTAKGERIFESIVPKFSRSFSNLSLYVVGVFGKNLDNIDSLRAGLHDVLTGHDKMGVETEIAYTHFEHILRQYRSELDVPVIDHKTLIQLGLAAGLEDEKSVEKAATVLQDYGTIIYFAQDARLANVVLLEPQWLARALSMLYNSQSRAEFGLLPHKLLATVWPTYSSEMRETLLYLCEKFEVAFSLKQEDYGSLRALKQRSKNLLQLIHGMSKRSLHRQLESAENEDDSLGAEFPASAPASSRDEDVSAGLSLVPALLSADRPTKRILTFIDGNFDALFEYNRKYEFDFIPNGMITRLLIRALQAVDVTLALWARGMLATAFGGPYFLPLAFDFTHLGVTVLVERTGNDDGPLALRETSASKGGDANLSNELVLKVTGRDAVPTVTLFTQFVDIIDSIAADWKIDWTPTVDARAGGKENIKLSEIEQRVAEQKKVLVRGKEIEAADLAPDVALALYKGRRILYSELNLTKLLGEGGYAEVYRGKWDGKEVAIKQLAVNETDARGQIDRREHLKAFRAFRHEIYALSEFTGHPNLSDLHGICFHPLALVQEFIPLGDIQHLAGDLSKDLSYSAILRYLLDITAGIRAIHDKHYLHRDLKSPNVMLASLDFQDAVCCKIIDFGCSIKLDEEIGLARGRMVDNPIWLAPEILMNKSYGRPSDIYAVGMIAWELLERAQPFAHTRMWTDIEDLVLAGERPPLMTYWPSSVSEIIGLCWHSDPILRPTAAALHAQLTTLLKSGDKIDHEYGAELRNAVQRKREEEKREREEEQRREQELQRLREIEAAKKLSGSAVPEVETALSPEFAMFLQSMEMKAAQKSQDFLATLERQENKASRKSAPKQPSPDVDEFHRVKMKHSAVSPRGADSLTPREAKEGHKSPKSPRVNGKEGKTHAKAEAKEKKEKAKEEKKERKKIDREKSKDDRKDEMKDEKSMEEKEKATSEGAHDETTRRRQSFARNNTKKRVTTSLAPRKPIDGCVSPRDAKMGSSDDE